MWMLNTKSTCWTGRMEGFPKELQNSRLLRMNAPHNWLAWATALSLVLLRIDGADDEIELLATCNSSLSSLVLSATNVAAPLELLLSQRIGFCHFRIITARLHCAQEPGGLFVALGLKSNEGIINLKFADLHIERISIFLCHWSLRCFEDRFRRWKSSCIVLESVCFSDILGLAIHL